MRAIKLIGLICILSITAECLPKTKELVKTLWKEEPSYIAIVEFKNDPLSPYQHPTEIDKSLMTKALESLKYQEISFFKWSKPKALFELAEAELFGEQLVQAFKEANSNQIVEFCLDVKRKVLLLPKTFIVCGVSFLRDDNLHLVFSSLLTEEEKWQEEAKKEDPRRVASLEMKRIYADKPVSYPTVDKQSKMFREAHSNWAIVDLEYIKAISEEQKTDMSIEERLRKLKELLDAGLITQEEYEEKRKEILKEL